MSHNALTGTPPSELGLMNPSGNIWLAAQGNNLTGTIPSEMGLFVSMGALFLSSNVLIGAMPSKSGQMSQLTLLQLGNGMDPTGSKNNSFVGSFPEELWELSHMEHLDLSNLPVLSGSIPEGIWMPILAGLVIDGSLHISGTMPEEFCTIETLQFDCSDHLCGCNCKCSASNVTS